MGKTIDITLKQLKNFIEQPYHNRFVMLEEAEKHLQHSLDNYVFTNHNDTWKIKNKQELALLIAQGGKNHIPARPRKGKRYNNDYLKRKLKHMGETRPHVYENYGLLHGAEVYFTGNTVIMRCPPGSKKGNFKDGQGDYISYHETQRSVLKLAFLRAWQNIIDGMVNALIKEARKP